MSLGMAVTYIIKADDRMQLSTIIYGFEQTNKQLIPIGHSESSLKVSEESGGL